MVDSLAGYRDVRVGLRSAAPAASPAVPAHPPTLRDRGWLLPPPRPEPSKIAEGRPRAGGVWT